MTRAERESRARGTAYRVIPELLRSSPRAKHGISRADLVVDPQPVMKTPTGSADPVMRPDLTIRITNADTLEAAARISEKPYARRRESRVKNDEAKPTVTIHNMANLTRPGGGFLTGSNSQEEFLCARTTLYASLFDDFYALPDVGGIFTPDVLVFRDLNAFDLPKRDRFFVNVISAGLPRHPENRGRYDEREVSCSCGVSYCDRDRDIVVRKMKAVLRMAQMKSTKQLVLGAWGCGGLGHPVRDVARLWRKVIAGSARQRRPNAEQWEGIDEIIFAIPNPTHAKEFRRTFEDILAPDVQLPASGSSTRSGVDMVDAEIERLIATATSLELQIEIAKGSLLKAKLREDLRNVNHEIALGRAVQAARDDDVVDEDEDVEDDYVVAGYAGSDGEENSFYRIDGTSDSESEGGRSEVYEFRFGNPSDSQTSQDEDELDEITHSTLPPSPQFDPQTGWFQGSIDELQCHAFGNGRKKGSISPRSPLVRIDSNAIDGSSPAVDGFLAKLQRGLVDTQG